MRIEEQNFLDKIRVMFDDSWWVLDKTSVVVLTKRLAVQTFCWYTRSDCIKMFQIISLCGNWFILFFLCQDHFVRQVWFRHEKHLDRVRQYQVLG